MGQLVTTVLGGALGFVIGGPFGAQIGAMLGGMIGSTLFGPTIKGPRLNDLKVSASTYGAAIPEIYGTVRIGGNMIWSTGLKETKHKSGGKGGPKQTTYTYDCTFAMALCKGPIDDVLRIWADGKLIYDVAGGSTRFNFDDASFADILLLIAQSKKKKKKNIRMRVYRGDEEQLPDSLIVADKGAGNVSAHRGIAYVVFEKLQLEDFGNRVPQLTFEITKRIAQNTPNLKASISESEPLPSVTNRTWIPDWELGRLYSWSSTTTDVLDLDTMQRVYGADFPVGGGHRTRYVPGWGLYFRTVGLRNSAPLQAWDLKTLAQVDEIGGTSNSLSGNFLDNCGRPSGRYGNLGATGVGFASAGGLKVMHLLLSNWAGVAWAFSYGNDTPLFAAEPAFTPSYILTGRTDGSSSQMISYRGANNQLELEVWDIDAHAQGSLTPRTPPPGCDPPSFYWDQAGYVQTRLDVKPFGQFTPRVVLYDPSDNHVFAIGYSDGDLCVCKYSVETGLFKFTVKHPGIYAPSSSMVHSRLMGGSFGYASNSGGVGGARKWVEIDIQTGALLRNDPVLESEFESKFFFGGSEQWDDGTSSLLVQTRTNYRRVFFRSGASKMGVAEVVEDICLRTNILTETDLDVSELENSELVGYVIDRETTARDVLKQLATAFLFDGYESDYKLKFRSRGNSSVVTIPEDWIARDNDNVVVRETITQEMELPLRVTVNYYDTVRDHQQGSQSMKRNAGPYPTMWTRKEDIVDLPIVWTPDDAKQCADKLLKMSWANRTSYNFMLPWKYMKYDPTDVATINLEDGTVYEIRLSDVTIGADFQIAAAGTSEKAAAYVSTAVGQVGESPPQSIPSPYSAYPIVANTPLLRDIDYDTSANATTYTAAGTYALTYTGAQIFMDDGFEYEPIGATDLEAVTGICLTTLPYTTAQESTDETFVLQVRLDDVGATLESITQEEMLTNYRNAALVGKEVIQFRDAVLNVDGTWSLTGILRARRGTNYAVRDHAASEQFLLLDLGTMTKFTRPPEEYVTTRSFKAVTSGTLIEDAEPYPFSLVPRDLMPYTPEDIKVTDDDTDVTISMARRSRVTAPLRDGTGSIHYKEGEMLTAHIKYKVWPGLALADIATIADPPISGTIPLFDSIGVDLPTETTFALSALGAETKFLLWAAEAGVVEGTPKWVECERLGENLWNLTELY